MAVKKKQLEMQLQKIPDFLSPKLYYEQYMTPADIAADFLIEIWLRGDIYGRTVLDAGCGTGRLSYGSILLGAKKVHSLDVDDDALDQFRNFCTAEGIENVEYHNSKVSDWKGYVDTVISNPPFGSQKKHADRPFLEKAFEISDKVYSLHLMETADFIKIMGTSSGFHTEIIREYKFELPRVYGHHRKERVYVNVGMFGFVK